MPPHRRRRHGGPAEDLTDADISFPLARLFDRFNLDHIPERKRMEEFEHRDLAHIKHYKAAVKIFGGPLSRKRVMVAPPMETPMKHRLGLYADKKPSPPSLQLNNELKPQIPFERPEPDEIVAARQYREREDNYKSWFKDRQKFRGDLENMGLNTEWLSKKPNKTALEKRVFRQLQDDENKKVIEHAPHEITEEISKETSYDSDTSSIPNLKMPAPLGLKILDQHLKEQKLRLIDLFTSTDKNKDWKISREEFIKICNEKKIPISTGLLEDMLISLDMNLDEELDYKEMARGMELARREKREDRRKELSREATSISQKSGSGSSEQGQGDKPPTPRSSGSRSNKTTKISDPNTPNSSNHSRRQKLDKQETFGSPKNQSITSSKSKGTVKSGYGHDGSRSLAGSPSLLEPPAKDTRQERLVLNTEEEMVDLRKRDREGLKGYNAKLEGTPATILTGNRAIDDHSMNSTLVGDVGVMVDKFRQKRLQEFFSIQRLCEEHDINLSEKLLERVLLYPPDKPHSGLRKVRHPDSAPLVSSHFADKAKRPRTPIEVKHKDKVRRSKSGKLMIDSRHKYPDSKRVYAEGYKQNLSTGRAVIRRRVDCWMTFEAYERLTRHLAVRYQHLHGMSGDNAFWPGHLLDKMRLCMPPYDKPHGRDTEAALFSRKHRTPAVNYGYEPVDVWPTNSDNYTQIGIHDHFRNKTII
ncbi:EF-hand calcium-binding domain-containing protein 12-like [Mya arenaria]|uniref:EF-hand calcium-binding domain-containing protein 12-like n=1 Tax=Mya arenaria TaxID=6604 RepID=UPI0022E694B5|nr:EF-hand calcium-binding domain-containing protein 12-like [Mya arenaria]